MRNSRVGPAAAIAALAAGASLAVASPAYAHAEIEVDPARAGATDALVTVNPESHHPDAGVVSVQVFPPEGITPDDVTLVSAPDGWEISTDDESYTVAGDELGIDAHPEHRVRVRQLPDAAEIYFRLLVTYADGSVERWIEEPSDDNPDPTNAAPGVELAPAAAGATSAAPASTPSMTAPASAESAPPAAASEPADPDLAADGEGGGTGLVITLAAIAAALVAAVGWTVVRRRTTGSEGGGAPDG